jgi:thymidylate synthase (FAD)
MKLIKPYFELIEQQPGEIGMLKHIETCGRVAWRSEDRITDDSYIKFNDMLKGVNHGSVLEHGTVYLNILDKSYISLPLQMKYESNKYSRVKRGKSNEYEAQCYVTTNYRVLIDNNWLDDLKYQCVTVRLVIDRGVSHRLKFVA